MYYALAALFVVFIFWLCAVCCSAKEPVIAPEPLDPKRLLRALKGAENWDGLSIGRAGEKGALQWREETWFQFSTKPFHYCLGKTPYARAELAEAEERYIQWLMHACRVLGRKPTPYLVGQIHTAGFGKVESGNVGAAKRDFAQRVSNLYYDER